MKYPVALFGVLVALVGVTGCHPIRSLRNVGGTCHDNKPYMKAQSVASLKIPPGLDAPDTTSALHIPPLNQPEPPRRTAKEACLDQPPPFNVPKQAPPQA